VSIELTDLMQSEGWKDLIILCESLERKQAEAVLNYNITKGPDELMLLKAQLDGARLIIAGLKRERARRIKED
jgi:hypothetical protein